MSTKDWRTEGGTDAKKIEDDQEGDEEEEKKGVKDER